MGSKYLSRHRLIDWVFPTLYTIASLPILTTIDWMLISSMGCTLRLCWLG
jgi:hypothetical protein